MTKKKSQPLSDEDQAEAKKLYDDFWEEYPDIRNPTDINTPEKEAFLKEKGRDKIQLMQKARKMGCDFTKRKKSKKKAKKKK